MDFRQLECFVAVAEALHFGEAAKQVYLSQSAFSRQIQRLEADLGVVLLDRTERRVRLTAGGKTFLTEARQALQWASRARASTLAAAEGRLGALRLGFVSSVSANVLPMLLRAFREEAPDVDVHLVERVPSAIVVALENQTVDVCITRGPLTAHPQLQSEQLRDEPIVALLPDVHPLAANEHVALTDLAGEPFVLFPRAHAVGYYDCLVGLCRAVGFEPRVVEEAEPMATIVALVGAGFGVTLAPASVAQGRLDVVGRPLTGVPPALPTRTALEVVWRKGDVSPTAARFRDLALRLKDAEDL